MLNFISVVPSTAELTHGENRVLNHSINHRGYLMHWERKLLLQKIKNGGLKQYGAEPPLNSSNLEQLALRGLSCVQRQQKPVY